MTGTDWRERDDADQIRERLVQPEPCFKDTRGWTCCCHNCMLTRYPPELPAEIKPHRTVEIRDDRPFRRPSLGLCERIPRGLLVALTLSALAIAVWALITIGAHS